MAAVDYFLKVDGIDGESLKDGHKAEIELESWSWGESQQGTHSGGGGGGAGKVSFQDLHCVAKISKASPKLMLACATGQHIKKAVLSCRKAGGKQETFLKVELEDLLVSSFQTGGSGHSDIVPTDQFAMNFSKIKFDYKEQKPDGSVASVGPVGFDVKAGKKL